MAFAVSGDFTTNPAYTTRFIPTIWSSKLNVKFYASTIMSSITNTAYEGEIKNMGDTVRINNIPTLTIRDYVAGQTLLEEVPVPNVVDLLIDKGKYFNFKINDVLEVQSQPRLLEMFTADAAKQMAITIDRAVLLANFDQGASANKGANAGVISGAYNLGTDDAPLVLTGENVLNMVTSLSSVLDEQNVPDSDRWLVINPYVRQIMMSSELLQAQITGDSASVIRTAKIGRLDRFDVYVSNNLPTALAGENYDGTANDNSDKRVAVMAGHKSAITFANQITKTETIRSQTDFVDLVRGLTVYGSKCIKPEGLALAQVSADGLATT